ncbi:hypothetical protein DYI37_00085 [Fulvimarina endophytica]|uniref:Uncharacterized protein n=1 Tax=Fulvimarina endophytica TaxID=2293836 RepID=A0A371X9L6_9HYPH|nr:hypothetical protein [Fulvimarina endophytica]RFC65933.1 hypothetical protein DYI37_00085 [Fulvimarina endophytica]
MSDEQNSNAPGETGAQATDDVAAAATPIAMGGMADMEESEDMDRNADADADTSAAEGVSAQTNGVADDGESTDEAAQANAEEEDAAAQANAEEEAPSRKAKTRGSAKAKAKAVGKAKPSRVRKDMDARRAKKDRARDARESDEEEANGKAARKAKGKAKAERQSFDLDRLAAEAKARVLTSVAEIDAIGRKTAENTFDLGREFEIIKNDIPDETDWKEAVPKLCGLSYKSADNWIKVHATLGGRREDLIRHQVTPTVLIKLTRATPEQVDQVIHAFEAGTPMKVREVEDLVKGNTPDANGDIAAGGGLAELKAIARAKVSRQTKAVAANVKTIRNAFLEALEAAGTKRLKKGDLVEALAPIARIACRDLTELVCDVDPASLSGSQALRHLPPADERWAAALKLLERLGYSDWVEATVLKTYVTDEVLPTLGFILDGGVGPAAQPDEADARNEAVNENQNEGDNAALAHGSRGIEDDNEFDGVDDDEQTGSTERSGTVMPFVARNGTGSGNGASGPQAFV